MATRLKTVHFTHPVIASLANTTLGTATQITVYLPETGAKTFRSVVATASAMLTSTAVGSMTTRTLQCRLGAAAYAPNTQTAAYTNSGEDYTVFTSVDLTSHFTTNWTGTSMTFDSQITLTSAATGAAWTNICITLAVTYEYDDTSTTQIKSVFLPLNAPVGALGTTQPGTATAVFPALDTHLPESSKVYRSIHIVVQGNVNRAAASDVTMSLRLAATATHTSGVWEGLSNTDFYYRYVWDCSGVVTSGTAQDFFIWGSVACFNHAQVYAVVTYEFNASTSTSIFNSVMLPVEMGSVMGGTTASDYQREIKDFWIEEPATITGKEIAFYAFWGQAAAIAGLNMRVGTGSFVTYTDAAATVAGSNACMVRNDAAFTLTRGRNSLNFDVYRTDAADLGYNLSGFWIVNYTSAIPTQGAGAANHTVFWNLGSTFNGAANTAGKTYSAVAVTIPETDYYINGVGPRLMWYMDQTDNPGGVLIQVERLAAEGGVEWEDVIAAVFQSDPETGLLTTYGQCKDVFWRWPNDPSGRIDIETNRRWRTILGGTVAVLRSWEQMDLLLTYHTITFTVAGTVSGYADADGAGLTVKLHRDSTGEYTEAVKSVTTTSGGAYTFTWYDNTEAVFASCYEDTTHVGRSVSAVAT